MELEAAGRVNLRKPMFFYGWVIVAIGFITLGAAFGVWYSFSVFILAVINEFGWSRAAASSIFSIFIFSQAIMNLATGHLQDRLGPRVVIPLGALVVALALGLAGFSQNLWHFAIAYGVLGGAGVSLLGYTSHVAFMPRWFERKRGLATGIAMSGIGFGMLLIIPLVENSIGRFGWRHTYVFLAVAVLLVVGPLNAVFARKRPEDMNLRPDGDMEGQEGLRQSHRMQLRIVDAKWAGESWTLSKALRTRRFWFLTLAFFFLAFANQGMLLHGISAMVDEGLKRENAAFFFGILGLAGSAGKISMGYLSDLYGRERVNSLGIVIAVLGIICLMYAGRAPMFLPLAFAILFGIGYGAAAPLLPAVCADIFLGRSFGLIFAVIAIGGGLGGAVGSFAAGLLRDMAGTYAIPLMVFIAALLISCCLIWMSAPGKVRRMVRSNALKENHLPN
jgi:MFS family permease